MDREKRVGIILIVIGLIIPLAVLPFVSGFSREKGFYGNLYETGIDVFKSANGSTPTQPPPSAGDTSSKPRITWSSLIPHRIPFRLFLVPTVLLAYMGIIRIDRARKRKGEA